MAREQTHSVERGQTRRAGAKSGAKKSGAEKSGAEKSAAHRGAGEKGAAAQKAGGERSSAERGRGEKSAAEKSGDGGDGGEGASSPIQVQKLLGGLDYPVSKDQIIEKARAAGAERDTLSVLERLPDREYSSPVGVSREIGKMR